MTASAEEFTEAFAHHPSGVRLLRVDPHMPEHHLEFAKSLGAAYMNDGSTPGPLLDAASFLLRGGELSEAVTEAEDVLRRASTAVAEPRHVERLSLLTAEALVRRDRVREAISTLEDALTLVPGSRSIRSNMELLGSRT